jgi:hypothetical protein
MCEARQKNNNIYVYKHYYLVYVYVYLNVCYPHIAAVFLISVRYQQPEITPGRVQCLVTIRKKLSAAAGKYEI